VAQPYSSEFYGEKAEEILKILKNAVRFFKELLDYLNKLDEKSKKKINEIIKHIEQLKRDYKIVTSGGKI
tara:strand:- start:62 stop:271 length:210 start_codon:yes stop_codon:yes gene_type:complete